MFNNELVLDTFGRIRLVECHDLVNNNKEWYIQRMRWFGWDTEEFGNKKKIVGAYNRIKKHISKTQYNT